MFKTYFYIVFLFASANLSCQSFNFKIQNDSISTLRQFYKKTKDTLFYKKAIQLAKETQNDSIIRETYILFGIQSYFNKDLKTLYKIKNNLYRIFKENNDSLALAKHYHYKALYFREKKIIDSSFFYYNKSKDISNQENDSLEVARRLLSMSTMQYSERDYLGCENSIIKGLRYIEPLNEIKYTSILYEKLGVVLRITDRFDEARESFRKAFRIKNQKGDVRIDEHAILYNHIAKSYEAQGNNKKAIEFYKKSLSTDDSLFFKYPKRYRTSLEGLSYNNFILGNKKLALKGYLEVLALREKINDKNGLVFSHSLLGEIYASNKQTKKAIFHTKKALYLSRELLNKERILENLFLLSKLIKGEKGRKYLQEHFVLNDSLFKRERSLKNQFAKVRYETEKKDIENNHLKEENNRKELQLESEKQQKTIGWLVAGGSILCIGFGASIASNRRKKLLFNAKLQQVEVREKERLQIAKSLHDEVAGDIRMLHLKLANSNQFEEAKKLDIIKENVRNLSHQLSSVSFDEVSFKNQIINLVSDYFDADFRIRIKEINSIKWKFVNNSIKRTLFLSVRESFQNTEKHAEAKNVVLSFSETKKLLILTISDNGKGFSVNEKKKGIGLKNMKERIEEINGVFSIKSELKKGTTIEIEIPKNG